jgi:hypothetical protein
MLWEAPKPVMQTLPKPAKDPYQSCRAAHNLFANTFVLTHPQDITAKFSDLQETNPQSSDARFVIKSPSVVGAHTVTLETCSWIFFSEEDLEVTMYPPYMHKTVDQDYGYIPAGKFNIARWFRPLNLTYQLWNGITQIKVKSGEPAMYINFDTDKKVILKRFNLSDELYRIGIECSELKRSLPRMHLEMMYNAFTKSSRDKKTLKLIKNNLLD